MSTLKTFLRGGATILLVFSLFVQARPASAVATVRYVAPGAACGGATPCYSSVQAAVTASAAGDEIRVAAGTYTGVNTLGGLSQMVYITKSLTIKGGYTTGDWVNQDPDTNATELQAQTLGRVMYISGATTNVTLSGLHLTYGDSSGLGGSTSGYDSGGGVYVYQSTITLDHSWVTNNASPSDGYGGGLYIRDGVLDVVNTKFQSNEAGRGGAAYISGTETIIRTNSEFRENRSTTMNGEGAAIYAGGGTLTLTDSIIVDSTASNNAPFAGALTINNQFTVDNIVVSGTVKSNGVALGGTGTLQNSEITNNGYSGLRIGDGNFTVIGNEISYNGTGSTYAEAGVNILGGINLTVLLEDNYIHHNQNTYSGCNGGGVYIDTAPGGWVTLKGNIIKDNKAGDGASASYGFGGGVYSIGDNITMEGNLIQNNTAVGLIWAGSQYWGGHGGGIYTNDSPTLINNVITGNNAKFKGSGIYVKGGSPNFYQTTIADNSAGIGNDQTGVYVVEKSSSEKAQPKFWNTIIANQLVGIYAKGDVTNNIVFADGILWYGNTANTDGTGTYFVANETTGDPLFTNPVAGDYHIGTGSAAIDVGLNTNLPAGIDADANGHPRIANGIVDLGAYENQDRYLLTVSKLGGGTGNVTSDPVGIDCGVDCSETYAANTPVTLTEIADPGSTFMGWSGDPDCADGQVTLTEDTSCKARFYLPVTLTVTKSGDGTGTVTSVPAGINCGTDCDQIYDQGTNVTLKATPDANSAFSRWTGAADCSDGKVTLNADITCTAVFKKLKTANYKSQGNYDGWILEKTETSNTGGSMNAGATTFNLGDDAQDRQYRAILSFNTGGLPNNAVITKVVIKIRKQGLVGTDPFNTHTGLKVDIRKLKFGTLPALQVSDFQAAASKSLIGTFGKTPVNNWYSATLAKISFPYINLAGVTQFRLRFARDDNDDHGADHLKFFSGNAPSASRPMLVITYYIP